MDPPFRVRWPTCSWLWLPVFLFAAVAASADQGKAGRREITAAELVKLGFFEDFAELDLEELLGASELHTSIASGAETTLGEAPGSVTVITAEEIRDLGARTLEDVLSTLPGFDIRSDSLGRRTTVVRGMVPGGTTTEGVLLLFNGRRLNDDLSGSAATINSSIPLGDVARIEVLRGPASTLYGNGAFSAVINVVTSTVLDFEGIGLEAGLGSFRERQGAFRVGNTLWGVSISGFVYVADVAGARLEIPRDVQPAAISLAPGPTEDRRRDLETAYRVSYKDFGLDFRFKNESSGGFVGYADSLGTDNDLNERQFTLDLTYRRTLKSDTTLEGTLHYAAEKVHELLEVLPPGYEQVVSPTETHAFSGGVFLQALMNERRYGAEIALDRKLRAPHRLRLVAGFERSETNGLEANGNLDFRTMTPHDGLTELPGTLPESSRNDLSLMAQDVWTATSRVTLTGGLRIDHGSDFGDVWSPRIALVAALPRDLGLRLSYQRGFRAPSFRERAFFFPGVLPNPDLRPTISDLAEASLTWKNKDLSLTGGVFAGWIKDAIGLDSPVTPVEPKQLVNLPDFRVSGVEIELRRNLRVNDSVFLNYTHQDVEGAESAVARGGIPADLATLGATFRLRERLVVVPTVLLRGKRTRTAGDPRDPVPAYGIVNIHLRAPKLTRGLELRASIGNLFDKRYQDPAPMGGLPGDYPQPGRSAFFCAAYKF